MEFKYFILDVPKIDLKSETGAQPDLIYQRC